MTQDFRQSGPHHIGQSTLENEVPSRVAGSVFRSDGLLPPQRLVLNVLLGTSVLLVCMGLALLLFDQSFFPAEIAPFIAGALILAGVSDFALIPFLKLIWRRANTAR